MHLTALPAGYRLQDYVIERVLGQGSFGITYKAHDTKADDFVAIKEYFPREFSSREVGSNVLASGDQQDVDDFAWGLSKFVEEATTLTRFQHPNLVSVQRFFKSNGTAYLVMDYCDGEPLDSILDRENTLDYGRIASLLKPLLDGLECVHRADVVHRDIKPGNIYIRSDGTPVLLDFGNVRNALGSHSRSIALVATPGYGAPEQYGSAGKQGPWTDIYGIAATLYRCITGRKPQAAPDRQLGDELIPLSESAFASYPRHFLKAIDSALILKPELRPKSVAVWRNALFDAKPASSQHSGPPGFEETSRESTRYVVRWLTGIFQVVVGISVAIILILGLITLLRDLQVSPATTAETSADGMSTADTSSNQEGMKNSSQDTAAPDPSTTGFADTEIRKIVPMDWAGGTYVGEVIDGVPNGQGEHRCCGGIVNSGNFVKGLLHGQGARLRPSGDRYEGNFVNGHCNGQGVLTGPSLNTTDKKENRFKALWTDCSNAQGVLIVDGVSVPMRLVNWKWMDPPLISEAISSAPARISVSNFNFNGGTYHGEIIDNKPDGKGRLIYSDGSIDDGVFVAGKLNGEGTRVFGTKTKERRYVGTFVDGVCVGAGTMYFPNIHTTEPDRFKATFTDCENGSGNYYFAEGLSKPDKFVDGKWLK